MSGPVAFNFSGETDQFQTTLAEWNQQNEQTLVSTYEPDMDRITIQCDGNMHLVLQWFSQRGVKLEPLIPHYTVTRADLDIMRERNKGWMKQKKRKNRNYTLTSQLNQLTL